MTEVYSKFSLNTARALQEDRSHAVEHTEPMVIGALPRE